MSTFLNKDAICKGILRLVENAEKKLTIIAPYIKLSDAMFQHLQRANERDVEIHVVYRKALNPKDSSKLYSLKNLNLLSHFDVHAKCFINETNIIITSMNLYEYSEKYNREMGILLDYDQDATAFKDALSESTGIVHSATLEKKSLLMEMTGFKAHAASLRYEKDENLCDLINSLFDNKQFHFIDGAYVCSDYYDNIDVTINNELGLVNQNEGDLCIRRIALNFKWQDPLLQRIYTEFHKSYNEYMFSNFKIYWSYHKSSLTIYRHDRRLPKWKELTSSETLIKFRQGISIVSDRIQNIERSLRYT